MSKPVLLDDVRLAPEEGVVAHIKEVLDKAKSGEIRGVVLVGIDSSGDVWRTYNTGDCDPRLLLAGLLLQQAELVEFIRDDTQWLPEPGGEE